MEVFGFPKRYNFSAEHAQRVFQQNRSSAAGRLAVSCAASLSLGRPPRVPFSRDALALAALRAEPPSSPLCCIHRREPKAPFGERWKVKVCIELRPMQSQSVRTDLYFFSFERGAFVSPSANAVGRENSQPPSSEITISARRAS